MKHITSVLGVNRFLCFGLALSLAGILTGCEDLNVALDSVLGIHSPGLTAAVQSSSPLAVIPAAQRVSGEQPAGNIQLAQATPGTKKAGNARNESAAAQPSGLACEMEGKTRQPGRLSPATAPPQATRKETFVMGRDPFTEPTEILPSDCPPSVPLCKFDRSQLKLVGIIQVSEGNYKAMVEDPDGRGYFVSAGMQIGLATVTQVTNKGITLHLHRTHQDVQLPLFSEARGSGGDF